MSVPSSVVSPKPRLTLSRASAKKLVAATKQAALAAGQAAAEATATPKASLGRHEALVRSRAQRETAKEAFAVLVLCHCQESKGQREGIIEACQEEE